MTLEEQRQQIRSTALNAIRKIYHPKYKFPYDMISGYWDDETYESNAEQRESKIAEIIKQMERDLIKLKNK